MRSTIVLLVLAFWPSAMTAETKNRCTTDADCSTNILQYCHMKSASCSKYTVCSQYHREESLQPSTEEDDCGKCQEGFTAESRHGDKIQCLEGDRNSSTATNWIGGTTLAMQFLTLTALACLVYTMFRRKLSGAETSAETPDCIKIIATSRDFHGDAAVEDSRPLKAVAYHHPAENNNPIDDEPINIQPTPDNTPVESIASAATNSLESLGSVEPDIPTGGDIGITINVNNTIHNYC